MISVLILTHNESLNLADCLRSVDFSDDIVVLDSGSVDETVSIAESLGAKVTFRKFDNYAAQRNFGLGFDFEYDWILMLDADEQITPELREEILRVIKIPENPVTLYRMRRKDMFMDKWLKRSSGYPTWFGRLFRKGQIRVERDINEEYYTEGEVGLLEEHLQHYPFNKGISCWVERHNRYSTMEASRLMTELSGHIPWKGFLSSDPMIRRKTLKQFAYRLPFRPILAFSYLYILRLGFLDGLGGFHYSCMRAMYEYMINLKMKEFRRNQKGLSV